MKKGCLSYALAGLLLVAGVPASAEDAVVHVYNWVEYIGKSTIADFERQTGIKVVYDVFDSNDVLQGKLLAGNSGYDVVVPTSPFLARLIGAKAFYELDHARLTNLSHMNPVLMKKLERFDPGNRFGIPYLWGTTGIGVNQELVKQALGENAPVNSWDLVFNPANMSKLKCGVAFLDAYDEIFPAVLNYKGLDPATSDTSVFRDQVMPVLDGVQPYITYYNSSKYINDLANGDICVALGWSGDILQAAARAKEANQPFTVSYTIPKEGTAIWFDMLAIPVDAPHKDNALAFINFLMDPKVIAGVSNTVRYANANKDSTPMVDPDILADPGIYPTDETNARSYTLLPYPQKVDRASLRMWTRLKTGR